MALRLTARRTAARIACWANTMGSGFCERCHNYVDTVNGRYTCTSCGHNGGA